MASDRSIKPNYGAHEKYQQIYHPGICIVIYSGVICNIYVQKYALGDRQFSDFIALSLNVKNTLVKHISIETKMALQTQTRIYLYMVFIFIKKSNWAISV